jgi:hypothetical protein
LFWLQHDFKNDGIDEDLKKKIVEGIEEVRSMSFPESPLTVPSHEIIKLMDHPNSNFAQGIKFGLGRNYRAAIDELSKAIERDPGLVAVHTGWELLHKLREDDRTGLLRYGSKTRP